MNSVSMFPRTSVLVSLLLCHTAIAAAEPVTIVVPVNASHAELLACREVRRYLYVRTGELLPLVNDLPAETDVILVGRKDRQLVRAQAGDAADRLNPQEYILKTFDRDAGRVLVIAGGDDAGTLYGAYRFAEHLGVRFYLEGDVIPDERIPLDLPELDERRSPLFKLRGIQPFHDFPEGPDWWDLDAYKAILSQLPKMGMNFFGLHTYPQGGVGPEPTVWIGRPQDMGDEGRVKESYPSRHFGTMSGTWGYQPKKTRDYLFGAAMLFDADNYCQDVQVGLGPWPATPEQCNELFNRFGEKLRAAFEHARRLGIKTCIGTETPLVVPTPVRERISPPDRRIEVVGGSTANYHSAIEGTDDDALYQSVRWNVQAYHLTVPNGSYEVTLKFCEIHHDAPHRRVFGVKLQGRPIVEDLDIFARVGRNKPLDIQEKVQVTGGKLSIGFTPRVEYPCIAGIVVQGPATLKLNCGATVPWQDYLTDEGRPPLQPADVEQLYTGMFQRIIRTHPLDYYWFWTPENWTWSAVPDEAVHRTMEDLNLAISAASKTRAPFQLATCGWVLGPQTNRALFDTELPKSMPLSCINRAVGHDMVEPAFAEVKNRPKWAIPWLEDDPALLSPQLWAGRMRKDAIDARAYGCTGLMGIHWRTRILGPNVSALARAAWDQSHWPEPTIRTVGAEGGSVELFAGRPIDGTQEDPIYQSQRAGLKSYCLPASNGTRAVTLQFCEMVHDEKGKRVFTVKVQGKPVWQDFDIFAEAGRGKALDKRIEGIRVTDGWLVIEFVPEAGEPCLAAIQDHSPYGAHAVNCGGPAYKHYVADPPPKRTTGRYLPVADFYRDWATQLFGPEVAEKTADLFTRIDGNLPRPSNWIHGPGGVFPDPRRWEQVRHEYTFVDELEALRPLVKGAGNLERFDYWLETFRYLRANGRVDCLLARQNQVMEKLKNQTDAQAKKAYARQEVLPVRIELVQAVRQAYRHLLASVTNSSELGTIANWEQHSLPALLTQPGKELADALGEPLPPRATPSQDYTGTPRLIVPVVRNSARRGETLHLRLIALDRRPAAPVLYWRPMGNGDFRKTAAAHRRRGVYEVVFPSDGLTGDIEYYVETTGPGRRLRFPPTAPSLNQTVIVTD